MKRTKQDPIPNEVYQVSEIVQAVVGDTPIGTNLGLYQGLMTMMSGEMLGSRGALIPALDSAGLDQVPLGYARAAYFINPPWASIAP